MIEKGVVLIDPDLKRRGGIANALAAKGLHVEPYESAEEYGSYPLRAALYLVADDADLLARTIACVAIDVELPAVIAYSDRADARRIVDAMQAGAANYLIAPFDETIFELTLGNLAVSKSNMSMLRSRVLRAKRKLECLTDRELQVLQFIADGLSSKEIGLRLGISHRTVDIHRANMMVKLNVTKVVQLARIAIESAIEDMATAGGLSLAA